MSEAVFGASNPLAPRRASSGPTPPEVRQDALLRSVGLQTPNGVGTPEYAGLTQLFERVTGSVDTPLDEARFVALAQQHWGLDEPMATAAFRACDQDGSQKLNRHEFALLARAIVTFVPERDSTSPAILDLRYRTVSSMHVGFEGMVGAK